MKENFILKKSVDWSVLKEGFSIPITFQTSFYEQILFLINNNFIFYIQMVWKKSY